MHELKDLPNFALEKILCKLNFMSKANLLIASSVNKNFEKRLFDLSKMKRPQFCPICILYLGTDYSEEYGQRYIEDLQNQLLNSKSGDLNLEWTRDGNIFSIDDTYNDIEYCIGYYTNGGRWQSDLMSILTNEKNYQRQFLMKYFRDLYKIDNDDIIYFYDELSLYRHILSCHNNLLKNFNSIKDFETLKTEMLNIFNQSQVIDIKYESKTILKNEIVNAIHLHITSVYLVFVENLATALSFSMEPESKQSYFESHLDLLLNISLITIKKMKFNLKDTDKIEDFVYVKRLMKLYNVLSIMSETFNNIIK